MNDRPDDWGIWLSGLIAVKKVLTCLVRSGLSLGLTVSVGSGRSRPRPSRVPLVRLFLLASIPTAGQRGLARWSTMCDQFFGGGGRERQRTVAAPG
jgi:hypothetical protein